MARRPRIDYAGAWHHVLHRSAAGRPIFLTNDDRRSFLALLGEVSEKWKVEIHAYSLMTNHYHCLVHTPAGNLPKAMHFLDGVYTQRFNYFHGHEGALFRGRYMSILIEKESYYAELVRYIHANSVRARMCKKAMQYQWSSHRHYMEPRMAPKWLHMRDALFAIGGAGNSARQKLDNFVNAGVPRRISEAVEKRRPPPILGSKAFIRELTQRFPTLEPRTKSCSKF